MRLEITQRADLAVRAPVLLKRPRRGSRAQLFAPALGTTAGFVPQVAIELWFDVRNRGRRLVSELCGAVGISAVAASIVIAGGGDERLVVAAWMILAARSLASIPYVRMQIARTHRRTTSLLATDIFQLTGVALAVFAVAVDNRVLLGTCMVMVAALAQSIATRRDHIAAVNLIGLRQMAIGLAIVGATATGAQM